MVKNFHYAPECYHFDSNCFSCSDGKNYEGCGNIHKKSESRSKPLI